jgi:hypothetical protein
MAAATYQAFLATPNASALAPNASINYITTTTAIHEPAAIVKHLQIQQKQVVKKDEKILFTLESDNGVCLETEITLQFNNGGGAFLPGMDENVIDERVVTFPLVHIVNFDANGKIAQMRLYWDQGTLLKQVEAIGRTGRNWPIREGEKLVEAVKSSISATGYTGSSPAGRGQHDVVINQHKRGESVTATRDPHATLALFAPRDTSADAGSAYDGPTFSTRPSAKPAPRDYGELFVGEETSAGGDYRDSSPTRIDGRAVKAGAGKHVLGNRLFDEDDPLSQKSPPGGKKTYEQKYDHFAFGNGEDAKQQRPSSDRSNGKSQATFSFEDFATPPKVIEKNKPDYQRHWGAGVDEVSRPVFINSNARSNAIPIGRKLATNPQASQRKRPSRAPHHARRARTHLPRPATQDLQHRRRRHGWPQGRLQPHPRRVRQEDLRDCW